MLEEIQSFKDFVFYNSEDGSISVQVVIDAETETIWGSQKSIAQLFGVNIPAISKHIKNIYEEGELSENTTISKMETVVNRGLRGQVTDTITLYNLDVIIAVGYRVNSHKATQFRIWATKVLKEYMIKGFALDDERIKQGGNIFGKNYFDELYERVKEIRASERMFYQKLTDIFAESIDYDKNSPITRDFYSNIQNRLEFAVIGQTAPEIILSRANANHPSMGLLTWKAYGKGGKIQLSDTKIAKNYMTEEELNELTTLVNLCLDSAELSIKRRMPITMQGWIKQINAQLELHGYQILQSKGTISRKTIDKKVEQIFEEYRPKQDAAYKSDFDKLVEKVKK